MKLSSIGQQLCSESGIVSLMEDLGDALNVNPDMLFLGGGNPASVPAFEQRIAQHLQRIATDPVKLHKLLGVYQSPRGNEQFISALAAYLRNTLGWDISERNLAVTNGSQPAFFLLFNMLAGEAPEGGVRRIYLPLMPEYLGYKDQALAPDLFKSFRPAVTLTGEHRFKYKIDFEALHIDDDIAALCVSRPTNPTGNVLTDDEMDQLNRLSLQYEVPLIVDCAYGTPFPGLLYKNITSQWQPNNIFVLSLSKLGLPGVRAGIVVAKESVINKLVHANTIVSLANGNLGPMLAAELLISDDLEHICQQELLPYYRSKRSQILKLLGEHLQGVNYRIHESEGAFFVWLWLPDLPISSTQLYERLKQRNVLVMAGEHFFFGLEGEWEHQKQCLRLNFCQSEEVMNAALGILAEELNLLKG
ncbi:valine--pyruvate transaminase [Teredinibacter haidensis]|uniref:valine--pyruvate transaminase n=1 Tax=Teredinibacter haidensis TaxID=2731755 RepID=UPI0009490940|nr:valine--pyruvate transaminase [Teredinibacter haidensis]